MQPKTVTQWQKDQSDWKIFGVESDDGPEHGSSPSNNKLIQ